MKNFFNDNKSNEFSSLEGQADYTRMLDEVDMRRFRREIRINSRHTSIVSYISMIIALASLIVSLLK